MKNFDWTTFTRKIAIKAPLADIYNAWTTASAIEKWFLSKAVFMDTNGKPVSKTTPIEKGYSYEWNWYLYDETERGNSAFYIRRLCNRRTNTKKYPDR